LSPNAFNREKAKRVLTERGTNIVADLSQWRAKQTSEKSLLEALWMYQAIDVVEPALLVQMLEAKDGRIRAAATRVLGCWENSLKMPFDLLARRIADDFPLVRLQAFS